MRETNPGVKLAVDLAAARLSHFDSALRKAEEREERRANSLVVLGVDPGCPGGWAMLDRDGAAIGCGLGEVEDGFLSPTTIGVLAQCVASHWTNLVAAIESFPPRPMMHIKSIAGLFAGVGAWRIAIRAAGFPAPAAVDPRAWQKRFKDEYREAEAKLRARFPELAGKRLRDKVQEEHRAVYHAEALRRWPDQRPNLVGPRGGARHDAAAALWIAEHHRLSTVGTCAPRGAPNLAFDAGGPDRAR